MKNLLRYMLLLLALGVSIEMRSQVSDPSAISLSKNKNYVATLTPRNESSSVAYLNGKITNYESANVQVSIQYMDGVGRPVQRIEYRTSPSLKDLVTIQEYTALEYLDKNWLPASYNTGGAYANPASITPQAMSGYGDSMPYSSSLYEEPVYKRERESYAPGQQWYNYKKAVKTEYLSNVSGDASLNCILYKVNGTGKNTTLVQSGSHLSGDLYVVRATDEDQNSHYTFTDKLGHQVMTREVNKLSLIHI